MQNARGKPQPLLKKGASKPHADQRQEQHIRLKAIACNKPQMIKRAKPRNKHSGCHKDVDPIPKGGTGVKMIRGACRVP